MTLAIGRRLGPYEIQTALGAGGMGKVYKARDTRLDRTVAIKILPERPSRLTRSSVSASIARMRSTELIDPSLGRVPQFSVHNASDDTSLTKTRSPEMAG